MSKSEDEFKSKFDVKWGYTIVCDFIPQADDLLTVQTKAGRWQNAPASSEIHATSLEDVLEYLAETFVIKKKPLKEVKEWLASEGDGKLAHASISVKNMSQHFLITIKRAMILSRRK